ncbi:1-acyl-sn-glycerol-3-phosphate acyltransferase [Alteriqipengyuania sp. WL0013]|uniref:1-acyl-sn-glycerol-3-phosphate acyltransferase n=1 Tax=Alteriqipengyuania sp. WL0013 TaxID=3110773 RepID=UPI002BE43412|nr:1-acyl-sn-glycerol-3-phosphate acyltransferase [Alteriqipengyuania sp. WL0013]MEB3416084.1 1-acyl-sn-glycerol-3-phosphate acyltransferase [Alteriqipengyuania sp. WL0013]
MSEKPVRSPSWLSRIVRWIIVRIFKAKGWRIVGNLPAHLDKYVIAGAPHSSNWDFVFFVGATAAEGVKPAFMGKHTLFKGIMRNFMFDMGGVPIDRSRRANVVEQVVEEYNRRSDLALVIAPEGTRNSNGEWRSGFYNIAVAAGVPIVPTWVNPQEHVLGFGEPIEPSGDYGADLMKIARFLRDARPDYDRYKVLEAQAQALIDGAG